MARSEELCLGIVCRSREPLVRIVDADLDQAGLGSDINWTLLGSKRVRKNALRSVSHKACEMGFCGLEQNDRLQPSKGEDVAKTSRQTAPGRLGISGPTHFAVRGRTDATPNHFIVSLLHKRAIVVDELCAFPYSLPEQPPSVQRCR